MKRNGFTLIELLAVIVILAIIALIATPIILGIINDAREESNERSVELYASAVRNGIAAHQLRTGNEVALGSYTTDTLPMEVEYEGDVECATIDIYEDGGVYVANCKVNDLDVDYAYGTKQEPLSTQVFKPQYYYYIWDSNLIVDVTSAPENPSTAPSTDKNYYLGYDVSAGTVTEGYVCFRRNETEYCLKGYDTSAYETNVAVIREAFNDIVDTDACSFGNDVSYCRIDDFTVSAESYGRVDVNGDNDGCHAYCDVGDVGPLICRDN